MSWTLRVGILAAVVGASSFAFADAQFKLVGTTSNAQFVSQSDATAGSLTIGIKDNLNQQAILFDNTSPPSNPTGIGPVSAGAADVLTLGSGMLMVDVTNMDTTGFPLGFGNSSTDYTGFANTFSFYVQDGTNTFFADSSLNSDHLSHLQITPQAGNVTIGYSRTGNGNFSDANFTLSGVAAVPEPLSLSFLSAGLVALLGRRRREDIQINMR